MVAVMDDVLRGRVFSYDLEKAFGFIVDENLDMRFFHISGVINDAELKPGTLVEFTCEIGRNGKPKATNIVKVG